MWLVNGKIPAQFLFICVSAVMFLKATSYSTLDLIENIWLWTVFFQQAGSEVKEKS